MDSKGLKAEGVPKSIIIDKMDYDYLSKLPTEIQQNIIRVLPINDIIALDVYYHFFVLVMVRYAAIYYAIYYEGYAVGPTCSIPFQGWCPIQYPFELCLFRFVAVNHITEIVSSDFVYTILQIHHALFVQQDL